MTDQHSSDAMADIETPPQRGMRARIARMREVWTGVFRLLKYSGRGLSAAVIAMTLAEVGLTLLALWMAKLLVDHLAGTNLQETGPGELYGLIAILGVTAVGSFAAQSFSAYLRQRQGMIVADQVDREIHDRALAVDLAFYESPAYYDSLQRAREAGTQRPAQLITNTLLLLKGVLFMVGVLVMLIRLDWRLPILLFMVAAALLVRLFFTRKLYEWQRRRTQLERRAGYLDFLLTSDAYAKELRLFGLGHHFRNGYSDLRRLIRGEQLRIAGRRALAEAGAAIIGALAFIGAFIMLLDRTLAGNLALGDLVLFLLLFRRAEMSGRETVSSFSQIYEDQLYLSQLFSFLNVRPSLSTPATPAPIPEPTGDGVRLSGVSFDYPGSERGALQNIDLHLPHGSIVAMLGENGAGKTTLIKLMTRLYDPDQGRVTLDGQDVRTFYPATYRRLFSVIFQDFAKYAARVDENIWFGDGRRPFDADRVKKAAEQAGADEFLRSLPQGYETVLTRLFDNGTELSIGQWQRVALSRAFLPESRFIVMDEPTSAVDPNAEMALFDTLRDRLGGRGALIISHRLLVTRYADYIYVMDQGRIAEHGTHEDLLARNGRYATLFRQQGRYFTEED